MRTNNKRGISLIVLVITIIVMIILAAAIILSLNSSGIIKKANTAKTSSDTANLKEYVNVLKAEYELMTESERGDKTSIEYINEKLAGKGYKRRLNEDGILLTENAVDAIDAGIKIGDKVTGYTLDRSKSSTSTSGKENTLADFIKEYDPEQKDTPQTVNQTAYSTWRYIGISENGEVLIAPEMPDDEDVTINKMKLSGKGAFFNGPAELDDVCNKLYSTDKGTARSMNSYDIYRILEYTKPVSKEKLGDRYYLVLHRSILIDSDDILNSASDALKTTLKNFVYTSETYWLATSLLESSAGYFHVASVYYGCVGFCPLFYIDHEGHYIYRLPSSSAVRPVVSLNSNVKLTKVSESNWSI